jgi:hypothetical protein
MKNKKLYWNHKLLNPIFNHYVKTIKFNYDYILNNILFGKH